MFSSFQNWVGCFSLRDWIPKGVSINFFSREKEDDADRDSSLRRSTMGTVEGEQPMSLMDWVSLKFFRRTDPREMSQAVQTARFTFWSSRSSEQHGNDT